MAEDPPWFVEDDVPELVGRIGRMTMHIEGSLSGVEANHNLSIEGRPVVPEDFGLILKSTKAALDPSDILDVEWDHDAGHVHVSTVVSLEVPVGLQPMMGRFRRIRLPREELDSGGEVSGTISFPEEFLSAPYAQTRWFPGFVELLWFEKVL